MEKNKNIAAYVRAKLTNKARESSEELQNLPMRFAAERFLYRIGISKYKDKFLAQGSSFILFLV